MARVTIRDVGALGVIQDRPAHELAPNAWTTLKNVRAVDGHLTSIKGESAQLGELTVNPLGIFFCPSAEGDVTWLYAGTDSVIAYNTTDGHVDISPTAPISATSTRFPWTGTWLNGVFFLNTKASELLVWDTFDTATPVLMKPMSTVTDTEFDSTWRFNSVRAYKEILIGIGLTVGGVPYPTTVAWSGPATAGTVPIAWDPANRNNIAGERPLSATPGKCVDGMQLGNNFVICKEDATILATFAQGSSPLVFRPLDNNSGVVAVNCMVEYSPGKMLIFNQNYDVMMTEGSQVVSILDQKNLRYLQSRVNPTRAYQSFVVHHFYKKEVWICYPLLGTEATDGELACQEALVWNYVTNTFSFHDLGRLTGIARGKAVSSSALFIDDVDTIIDESDDLIDGEGVVGNNTILGCSFVRDAVLELDVGVTIDGAPLRSTMERKALAVIGQDFQGSIKVDHHKVKIVHEIWPVFEVSGTSFTVDISVGSQEYRDGSTDWDGPYVFIPGEQQEQDFFIEGIYITVKFEVETAQSWKLHSYGIELAVAGDAL